MGDTCNRDSLRLLRSHGMMTEGKREGEQTCRAGGNAAIMSQRLPPALTQGASFGCVPGSPLPECRPDPRNQNTCSRTDGR